MRTGRTGYSAPGHTSAAIATGGRSSCPKCGCKSVDLDATDISEAQLWPERFDLAVTVAADGTGVNVGFSPGDRDHVEPYVYVGPHDLTGLDGDYWNAPFGAVLTHTELRAVADPGPRAAAFVTEGLSRVARHSGA